MRLALQRIAERSGKVSAEVKSLRSGVMAMLLGTYRAEEAALRERLKVIAETRERPEGMNGAAQEVQAPGSDQKAAQPSVIEQAHSDS